MSFLDTLPHLDEKGNSDTDSPWSKSFRDSLPLQNATVLVLDRSVPSTKHLKDELSLMGATQFDVATNVNDFLRLVADRKYDLVFIDYNIEEERHGAVVLEELRERFGSNLQSSVIMVCADRSAKALMNLMEFEPDAFLIKPYSAEELSKRAIRIFARRSVMQNVYKAQRFRQFDQAIAACDEAIRDFPNYERELVRCKVNLLLESGATDDAEQMLKSFSGINSPAWMDAALADIYQARGERTEAESWLRKAITNAPHYVHAQEKLADLLTLSRREEEALALLEGLNQVAHPSVRRLRQMADLAGMLGYRDQERAYLLKLIEKTHSTTLAMTGDHYRLAQNYVIEQRPDDAFKALSKLKGLVDAPEAELAEAMVLVFGYHQNNDTARAQVGMEEIAKKQVSRGIHLSQGGQAFMMLLCQLTGMKKKAESLHAQLMKTTKSPVAKMRLNKQMHGGSSKLISNQ